MVAVAVRTYDGASAGTVSLDEAVFGTQPNVAVLHQVVTAQLAAARSGTHSTKTRAEVAGGGKKPWRQKGTGRARQGSSRAPHWSGGGIALGPKPRDYRQKTPKKMIQLALRSALSDRAREQRVMVVEEWSFRPKTKSALASLRALGLDGRVLVVVEPDDDVAVRAFRNLPQVKLLLVEELNAYDVLCSDWVVFTRRTLPGDSATSVGIEGAEAVSAQEAQGLAEGSVPDAGSGPVAVSASPTYSLSGEVEATPGEPGVGVADIGSGPVATTASPTYAADRADVDEPVPDRATGDQPGPGSESAERGEEEPPA